MKHFDPPKGTHLLYCSLCGEGMWRMTHFGGKRILKTCYACIRIPHYCWKCLMRATKQLERIEKNEKT